MNLQTPTVAVPAIDPLPYMPDVINSLKRLERIGTEESQTVQKILEAASELSGAICKSFPRSLTGRQVRGYVMTDGTYRLGSMPFVLPQMNVRGEAPPRAAEPPSAKPQHDFGTYAVIERRLYKGDDFVGANREIALEFAKDISMGLLDVIVLFIETEHAESARGLDSILGAAELLKNQQPQ